MNPGRKAVSILWGLMSYQGTLSINQKFVVCKKKVLFDTRHIVDITIDIVNPRFKYNNIVNRYNS